MNKNQYAGQCNQYVTIDNQYAVQCNQCNHIIRRLHGKFVFLYFSLIGSIKITGFTGYTGQHSDFTGYKLVTEAAHHA